VGRLHAYGESDREHGRFDGFADAASGAELNALFGGGA